MKELARWGVVCICAVAFQLGVTLWFLVPYLDDHWYGIFWATDSGSKWRGLTPYYAWPILVTYGGALVMLASVVGVAVGRAVMLQERQAIATREAAVGLQEAKVRIDTAKAKRTMAEAEGIKQTAREAIAKCRQEAAAKIEHAEFRLQRSVGTNIGLHRQVQKLRKRVTELEGEDTMGHC